MDLGQVYSLVSENDTIENNKMLSGTTMGVVESGLALVLGWSLNGPHGPEIRDTGLTTWPFWVHGHNTDDLITASLRLM